MMREWIPIARIPQRGNTSETSSSGVTLVRPLRSLKWLTARAGFPNFAVPDSQVAVYDALAHSAVVFSYMESTVLFEACFLGLTPVSVCGGLYDDNPENLPPPALRYASRPPQTSASRHSRSRAAGAALAQSDLNSHFDWESILMEHIQAETSIQGMAHSRGARV